ncbi:Haem-binding domain-containing protein [Mariniphaga anaerophila]|uniref:Haem-binding domain-containing protein n=1 Tax=Mariniphaga anaerophila TaxID=1484053 RepID=A0A1M4XY75_9BACT|nr:heme-binding domain-containing protein [Mariniphaga anaerophila]SHE98390.1 Haem-binding domain-containing protein [Mariniphaga anaerophila]
MKKLTFPTFIFLVVVFSSFILNTSHKNAPAKSEEIFPEHVKEVIDQSCFQCHNINSKNDKGKEALDFSSFNQLSKVKKITTLKEISEVIEKGEMPPKKFLEKFPDKKLTKEQSEKLSAWAKNEMQTLLGN